jgi:hypothetical protein
MHMFLLDQLRQMSAYSILRVSLCTFCLLHLLLLLHLTKVYRRQQPLARGPAPLPSCRASTPTTQRGHFTQSLLLLLQLPLPLHTATVGVWACVPSLVPCLLPHHLV